MFPIVPRAPSRRITTSSSYRACAVREGRQGALNESKEPRPGACLPSPFLGLDLSANFAAGARHCVNVGICLSCANRAEQLCHAFGFELLRRDGHHVIRHEITFDRDAPLRTRRPGKATAEKDRDTAIGVRLTHMNMGSRDRCLQTRVFKDEVH
jgi:hypothetical protein